MSVYDVYDSMLQTVCKIVNDYLTVRTKEPAEIIRLNLDYLETNMHTSFSPLNQKYSILFWLSICFPYNINYFLFYTNKSPFVRGYLRSLFKIIFRRFGDA